MAPRANNGERIAVLEQKVTHMDTQLASMSTKVDEMHAVLMRAKGVRWTVIVVASAVSFVTGVAPWLFHR